MNRLFAPDPGASRLAASMDRLLAARDLRRGGAATPAAIDASPSARLAASMDRELARHGIRKAGAALGFVAAAGNPRVSEASKPVDISGMDLLSRSMRARLPAHQRAAYDRDWKQSELERPAPIAPKVFAPSPPPAITPTRVDAIASGVFDPQPPAVGALTVSAPEAVTAVARWSPPLGRSSEGVVAASSLHPFAAIFAAAFGREPRDGAEVDAAFAAADIRARAAGLEVWH
jgi:hypothetical protein